MFPEDVPFLLKLLAQESDTDRQTALTLLIDDAWKRSVKNEDQWLSNFSFIADTWNASRDGSGPKRESYENYFNPFLLPVEWQSPEADQLRAQHQQWLQIERNLTPSRPKQPTEERPTGRAATPARLIRNTLDSLDAGTITVGRAWWKRINYLMHYKPNREGILDEGEADLTSLPCWDVLDETDRKRIVEVAKRYLLKPDRATAQELKDATNRVSRAGYRAFTLLLKMEPEWIETLAPEVWARWVGALVFFPDRREVGSVGDHTYLNMKARQQAPAEWARSFTSLIDEEARQDNLRCLEGLVLWEAGDIVAQTLFAKAHDLALPETPFRQILSRLVKEGDADTLVWAKSLIPTPPPVCEPERMRARVAAEVLFNGTADAGFPQVFSAFENDDAFGREVVSHAAPQWFLPDSEDKLGLSEKELADLHLWLARQFPHDEDEVRHGVQRVTTRYQIAQMRDAIFSQIGFRKTEAGCQELERIVQTLPEVPNLNWNLEVARTEWRRASWSPLSTKEVLQLGRDAMSQPTIAIITALSKEHAAMLSLMENSKRWKAPNSGASGTYDLGIIPALGGGEHGVVLALLPDTGNNLSAVVTSGLLRAMPTVRHVIVCGIAGGVPSPKDAEVHVRMGDIVVSGRGGVVQYDFGKMNPDGKFEATFPPRAPAASLLHAYKLLHSDELRGKRPWLPYIKRACEMLNVQRAETDTLLATSSCRRVVSHPNDPDRISGKPRVFDGTIAAANAVLKDPVKRDELRDQHGIRAVEMETSGIADATWEWEAAGYFAVRGICDYCDKRNKAELGEGWQAYAAIVAAAYTRALIESLVLPEGT